MNIQDMAGRLNRAGNEGEAALEQIRNHPDADRAQIEKCLKKYIAAKLLLKEEEMSDNIVEMVRLNVSKASHISVEKLKEMDRPGACGSAPAVLAKRVLLYVGIQNALGITFPAEEMPEVRTVQALAEMIEKLMRR